jgi:flagella basal body P-ring formation protein FlgA
MNFLTIIGSCALARPEGQLRGSAIWRIVRLLGLSVGALCLAGFMLPANAAEEASEPATNEWRLVAEARVDSSGIFLDQLVQPVQPVALPHIRLAPAPPLGQTVIFSRQQVVSIIQTNLPAFASTNWTGPRQVRILRRMRSLAEPELNRLVTDLLQREEVKNRGELELHFMLTWTPVLVPDETLSVKLGQVPQNGLSANCMVGIELWTEAERVATWQLGLHARIWHDVAVAHSPVIRGTLLKDADVAMQRMDVLMTRDALQDLSSLDGLIEVNENVSAGQPIPSRALKLRPLVKRGRIVEGVFREGSLEISLKVETLEDGTYGQTVRVRNPKTRRELYGKVQNEQTVIIDL